MANTAYLTIAQNGISESEIRRSRFIARAFPITCADEAEQKIIECRKSDWKATHHCFAFTTGLHQEIQKASDDGEPSGTAGVPILDVLKRHQICQTLLVVTRYFGGIKLGAGGLIRAYAHSARAGIIAAGLVEHVPACYWQLTVAYHLQGTLDNKLRESSYIVEDETYTEHVTYTISILQEESAQFQKQIADWCNGQARLQKTGEGERLVTVDLDTLNLL